MLNLIQFRRQKGGWDGIKKENFSLLINWIKKGEIDAIASETLTAEEAMTIKNEGFVLIPDMIRVGSDLRPILRPIVKIEEDWEK